MLDIGGTELLVIAIATIIIVGPRELPRVLRTVMGYVRKIRQLAGDFQGTMDEMARDADLADLRKELKEVAEGDIDKDMDPTGSVRDTVNEIRDGLNDIKVHKAKPPAPTPRKWPPDDDEATIKTKAEPLAAKAGDPAIAAESAKRAKPEPKKSPAAAKKSGKAPAPRKSVAKATAKKATPAQKAVTTKSAAKPAKKTAPGKTAGKKAAAKKSAST